MTLLEASDKILNWFQTNEYFCFEDSYKEMIGAHITLNPNADRAAIELSLKALEKNELIQSTSVNNITYWILSKPFHMFDKNLTMSYSTCLILSEIGKQASEQFGNKDLLIDPTNIAEKDILKIIGTLIQSLKSQISQKQENIENN